MWERFPDKLVRLGDVPATSLRVECVRKFSRLLFKEKLLLNTR